ncbi:TMEM175 family protein [Paenibacillus sp. N1-5-1-14]|uniref:TMEM175 family protein n=1 Tax=Paenibacillus radicibacter TaxID=2972488 RepID=UPI00215955AC|nr:TMEM175 family protein [Paenibacillus radicibacter]MCR8644306.1 TMEM175 family protein [Paenibacillus radicibacter]
MLTPQRIEAFSDGVFAIVITLLILEIKVPSLPEHVSSSDLFTKLFTLGPKLLSYVLSFLVIGVYWIAHHFTFHQIRRADRQLLIFNLLFLMSISFIPFPAALLGEYPHTQTAVMVYGFALLMTGITFNLIWWHASRNHRLIDSQTPLHVIRNSWKGRFVPLICYLIGMGLSFVHVYLTIAIYIIVPLYYLTVRTPSESK